MRLPEIQRVRERDRRIERKREREGERARERAKKKTERETRIVENKSRKTAGVYEKIDTKSTCVVMMALPL